LSWKFPRPEPRAFGFTGKQNGFNKLKYKGNAADRAQEKLRNLVNGKSDEKLLAELRALLKLQGKVASKLMP
jgi:hypothetical protein